MSIENISIKHNKHKLYHCPETKKLQLLKLLIEQNAAADILVAVSESSDTLKESITAEHVRILSDEEIAKEPEQRYDLVISFDLPSDAGAYISRAAKAAESAIILMDRDEQEKLYRIETLLKRAIRQESMEGFGYEAKKEKAKKRAPIKGAKKSKKAPAFSKKPKKEESPKEKKPKRKIAIKELKPKPANP